METLLLGIIQGLTEFLPVSSSGHLILAQTFLGMDTEPDAGTFLAVMLHVATGIAVLIVFRKDILNIIRGCFSKDITLRKDSLTYSGWVVLATIPAMIIGLTFKSFFDGMFDTSSGNAPAYLTSLMLFFTAGLLIFSSKKEDSGNGKLTFAKVIIIGLMQAVAIMPGISRSGSTIAIALLIGVSREEAGRFSFMLSLPVIFGAALLDARKFKNWESVLTFDLVVGFIAAFVIGIVAIKLLLSFIKKGKLHYFGYYCATAATVSLVWLTVR
ncbi:MAG: undecaprenyl-diphosphate phosphatase [Chitinispirillales bacterium]|jgi:undecaprenyl-diphosphatase|nr:undecaprenyl-diphosphate phosphatase [Chitinispirillales bacterium]